MSQTQLTIQRDGRSFHLIAITGQDDDTRIAEAIQRIQPDHVCVALCQTRLNSLLDPDQWLSQDVVSVVRNGQALLLLTQLGMAAYLHRLDHQKRPGAEFAAAVRQAQAQGLPVTLIDRDIRVTLKRAWRTLNPWGRTELFYKLVRLLWSRKPLPADHHQQIQTTDSLSAMTKALTQSYLQFNETLILERDRLLMSAVETAPGNRILAVVGAGAFDAMAGHLGAVADPQLHLPPKRRPLHTAVAALLAPLLVIALFMFAKYTGSQAPIGQGLGVWVGTNFVLVGLFTIIAGAHKRTILIAMLTSPISLFLPLIKAGTIAGILEGKLRKPTVADCEQLPKDMHTMSGAYANPVTRVLWVFLMASLGSALGTYVGLFLVMKAWFA